MSSRVEILSTRPVEEEWINIAKENSIDLHVIPFIKTGPVESVEVHLEIEQALLMNATVVFTSMNAVEAVHGYITDEFPQWNIYCIGFATASLVEKYFPASTISGTAPNAEELARVIIEENLSDEVIFFCGDQRRDELPQILKDAGIAVSEVVVYETFFLPRKVSKHYDGILFFSPSAVKSFFSVNTIDITSCIFAIGSTTGDTVRQFCDNRIILANEPSKSALLNQAIEYFT